MKGKRRIAYILAGIAAVLILAVVAWMVMETGVEVTSHAGFCGTCHAMEPMVASYKESIHGGNNPYGVAADCTACHTSHKNVVDFFFAKARSGTHDIWVTLVTDELNRDWQAKREHRDEYVYDSGCLTCHSNLETITAGHGVHAKYFAGQTDRKCVDCHPGVGHEGLNKYLLLNKYRYYEGPLVP